ncbi:MULTISPECIES: GNAT family N-acetyltransferase [Paraliobacillus]|uniref:GNAT family N-acetyltransferase n=1 Tax=Paraliobacillus TaxID=200903 RepID=UPI000DD37580|nr:MULTISPECIES: GNAT family N-acetyltransferase [Paraliobacillus]
MKVTEEKFTVNGITYNIKTPMNTDAKALSDLRLQIDGETENLDRVRGEEYIDLIRFEEIIKIDNENAKNLFLVVTVNNRIIGYSRCTGNPLQRFNHNVEFGVCVLKEFWSYQIGGNLLQKSIKWADDNHIKKINLRVMETNSRAIKLYQKYGFEIEGVLKRDKLLSDGNYYNTIMMARFKEGWN